MTELATWGLMERASWAAVAAAGFAVLFNVPPRLLVACGCSGALGFATRAVLVATPALSIEIASWAAATLVSLLAVFWGKRLHAPAVVFAVPGVIPLLPGSLAFRTMLDLLAMAGPAGFRRPDLAGSFVGNAIECASITGALAFGVALPSLVLRRHIPMT